MKEHDNFNMENSYQGKGLYKMHLSSEKVKSNYLHLIYEKTGLFQCVMMIKFQ